MEKINNFINEKLKINSNSKINQNEELNDKQKEELENWEHVVIDSHNIPKDINRKYLENFINKILNHEHFKKLSKSHLYSSIIYQELYDRLYNYVNNHVEDNYIEIFLKDIIKSYNN